MSHKGSEINDVSPDEAEIIKFRAERRLLLRNQYLKEIHNPDSKVQGDLFDPAFFRVYSTMLMKEKLYKPKPFHFLQTAMFFTFIYGLYRMVKYERDGKDHLYRTGQVSYRDRNFKFC